jgi:hypothetical protein
MNDGNAPENFYGWLLATGELDEKQAFFEDAIRL